MNEILKDIKEIIYDLFHIRQRLTNEMEISSVIIHTDDIFEFEYNIEDAFDIQFGDSFDKINTFGELVDFIENY